MSIETEIARIARSSADRKTLHDALGAMPGAVAEWDGLIRCENFMVSVLTRDDGDSEHDELLVWLRGLNISAAPELVARHPAGELEVYVQRYWICPGERLLRVAGSNVKFNESARARFRTDMERLFDHGKMHVYIRGDAHWWVSERTGAIVLSDWQVRDATPKHRADYFESIENTFARHS